MPSDMPTVRLSFSPSETEWLDECDELDVVDDDQLEPLEYVTELFLDADFAVFQKRPISELVPLPLE